MSPHLRRTQRDTAGRNRLLTPHFHAELGQQSTDPLLDFVPNRANGLEWLARGIGQWPFLVTAAGNNRAGITATHRDDDIGGAEHLVGPERPVVMRSLAAI